jgi:UrcA family protein
MSLAASKRDRKPLVLPFGKISLVHPISSVRALNSGNILESAFSRLSPRSVFRTGLLLLSPAILSPIRRSKMLNSKVVRKISFAFVAVTMAGTMTHVTTAPAFAASEITQSVAIDTSGYDLRSASGYALVTNRIERAAEQVCGAVDSRRLAGATTIRNCHSAAVEDALVQLSNISRSPTVTVGASR